jgi:predicted small lipoprotein YifL
MRSAALILIALTVALLAGCGQKGPLTLPEKHPEAVVTRPAQTPAEPAPPADETKKKKDETEKQP